MYTIRLPFDLNGVRYGVVFTRGVGQTDDVRIAKTLMKKGLNVTEAAGTLLASEAEAPKKAAAAPKPKKAT